MHIKSMVIDGFKSYGQRTVIDGFDEAFNAITGLNGSGKSNILDAICFLLGITNLSHVRATNLQELVYKNGQAGIMKATVTITFDNSDKNQSPMGYEHFNEVSITRQVVIGGKNKYLINGTNIQSNRVQDFFRSVQLNVNNPHFLIMQGRITKVLNMKPPEVLAMIEEAAGTMMYESKKQQAQKTIEKKDSKLREINVILSEEITPTLTKLKEERSTYLEYQKIQRELEHLTKLCTAHRFVIAKKIAVDEQETLDTIRNKKNTSIREIKEREVDIRHVEGDLQQLQQRRDKELGGHLEELESALAEKEKKVTKCEASLKETKENAKAENRKKEQITKGMKTDQKAHDDKDKTSEGLQAMFDKLRNENEECTTALRNAQKRFEAISVGKFSSEDGKGRAATLQEQVIALKSDISNAETTKKTSDMKIKHNKKEMGRIEKQMMKTEAEFARDGANLPKLERDVKKAETEVQSLEYTPGVAEETEGAIRITRIEANALEKKVYDMSTRYQWLNFEYDDPERNFKRSQVRGVAAKLFKVKDPKFFIALDTAGGAKLHNVVVNTSDVAGKILRHGRLQRRTIFLPLDKMDPRVITQQELKAARRVVGGGGSEAADNVQRAIDLIEYDEDLRPAMEHIFGNTLVCTDLEMANKVAFNHNIRKLCVTLEGDKVDPGGMLSGGSRSTQGSPLMHVADIMNLKATLTDKEEVLRKMEDKMKRISIAAKKYNQLNHHLETKRMELERIQERLKHTEHHGLKEDYDTLMKETKGAEASLAEADDMVLEGSKKVKDLEHKIKNAQEHKEKELKDADADVKKYKKAVDASKAKWSEREAEEARLKLEIEELKKTISEADNQLRTCDEAFKVIEKKLLIDEKELEESKGASRAAKEAVKEQKDKMVKNNKEINTLQSKRETLASEVKEKELIVQELDHKISKAIEETHNAERTVKHMLKQFEWITVDQKFFGEPGSAYDFKATDPKDAAKRVQKLEDNKEKLERTVNLRAMTMLDKAEVQFNDLMRKKLTVETDKAKIKKVIAELDRKKKEELRAAWDKVNHDFGSIFSTLLPGSKARLQPPEGLDVLDGLEVKVAFGDVWKESLNELSGGQRSLVALSLILSLLLFKPAPLYILDEVDAALDLSHTQNIGRMLKTHFKHSQFIVVSLKDGMFNNANVLFRTKFVDGMSTVSRTVNKVK